MNSITSTKLEWLKQKKLEYQPSLETREKLAGKVLTMVVGVSAVGKSTIIEKALEVNGEGWAIGGSLTTRGRRSDDPDHYQTADEGIDTDSFVELVSGGKLTNFSIVGEHLYGSTPDSFPERYNLLPTLTDSIAENEKAGFERTNVAYILAPGKVWEERLLERANDKSHAQRLREALISLNYGLEHLNDIHFIDNPGPESLRSAADVLSKITLTGTSPEPLDQSFVLQRLSEMSEIARNKLEHYEQ